MLLRRLQECKTMRRKRLEDRDDLSFASACVSLSVRGDDWFACCVKSRALLSLSLRPPITARGRPSSGGREDASHRRKRAGEHNRTIRGSQISRHPIMTIIRRHGSVRTLVLLVVPLLSSVLLLTCCVRDGYCKSFLQKRLLKSSGMLYEIRRICSRFSRLLCLSLFPELLLNDVINVSLMSNRSETELSPSPPFVTLPVLASSSSLHARTISCLADSL